MALMSPLFALQIVNPADSVMYTNGLCTDSCSDSECWWDDFSLRFGFYGDYVFDRHLQVNDYLLTAADSPFVLSSGGDIYRTQLYTNAGMVLLNFCDWIEAYATFGVSRMELNLPNNLFGIDDGMIILESSSHVSYSVGAAAPIWQSGNFTLGVQAQYFYFYPNMELLHTIIGGIIVRSNDNRAKYVEYQGALAASYTFENEAHHAIIPFAAIQFSGVSFNLSKVDNMLLADQGGLTVSFPRVHQQRVVGWTIGTSMMLNNAIGVTAEARFANEKALGINGQFRF